MIINDKITIYGRTAENRIVIQPMEGCDGNPDGSISELTRRRYMRFARSGAAIIWFEATATSDECRANPRQLYLNDDTLESFKLLVADIKEAAVKASGFAPIIILQSTNSGRWSKPKGTPAPLIAYHNELWEKGKEDLPYTVVTDEYCDGIVGKYVRAATLAEKAGFDGIDVKCCHGYLMSELLSAYNRPGKYGGSFENRTRLYFDCIRAVKANCGKLFVTTRLNACDCFPYPYGFGVSPDNSINLDETEKIIEFLVGEGIELIDLTIGNPYLIPHINRPCRVSPESREVGIERIFKVTRTLQAKFPQVKFVLSGLSFTTDDPVEYAEKCLENGAGTFAGFGRMAFCYPEFYKDFLAKGKTDKSKICLGCARCTEIMRHGGTTGCPIRDSEFYMPIYNKYVGGDAK